MNCTEACPKDLNPGQGDRRDQEEDRRERHGIDAPPCSAGAAGAACANSTSCSNDTSRNAILPPRPPNNRRSKRCWTCRTRELFAYRHAASRFRPIRNGFMSSPSSPTLTLDVRARRAERLRRQWLRARRCRRRQSLLLGRRVCRWLGSRLLRRWRVGAVGAQAGWGGPRIGSGPGMRTGVGSTRSRGRTSTRAFWPTRGSVRDCRLAALDDRSAGRAALDASGPRGSARRAAAPPGRAPAHRGSGARRCPKPVAR